MRFWFFNLLLRFSRPRAILRGIFYSKSGIRSINFRKYSRIKFPKVPLFVADLYEEIFSRFGWFEQVELFKKIFDLGNWDYAALVLDDPYGHTFWDMLVFYRTPWGTFNGVVNNAYVDYTGCSNTDFEKVKEITLYASDGKHIADVSLSTRTGSYYRLLEDLHKFCEVYPDTHYALVSVPGTSKSFLLAKLHNYDSVPNCCSRFAILSTKTFC